LTAVKSIARIKCEEAELGKRLTIANLAFRASPDKDQTKCDLSLLEPTMTDPTKTLLDLIAADENIDPAFRRALRPNERYDECPLCRGAGGDCACCAGRGYIVMERNDESYIAPSDERNFGWY